MQIFFESLLTYIIYVLINIHVLIIFCDHNVCVSDLYLFRFGKGEGGGGQVLKWTNLDMVGVGMLCLFCNLNLYL